MFKSHHMHTHTHTIFILTHFLNFWSQKVECRNTASLQTLWSLNCVIRLLAGFLQPHKSINRCCGEPIHMAVFAIRAGCQRSLLVHSVLKDFMQIRVSACASPPFITIEGIMNAWFHNDGKSAGVAVLSVCLTVVSRLPRDTLPLGHCAQTPAPGVSDNVHGKAHNRSRLLSAVARR